MEVIPPRNTTRISLQTEEVECLAAGRKFIYLLLELRGVVLFSSRAKRIEMPISCSLILI
jgi:hypothetical protein